MNSWDGSVNGYIGVILDITQKKKAEEQLFRNESLLQLMSSSSPLGFLLVDNNTDKILYFNHRFCELWEITSIEEQMKRGEFLNNDIIPYCLPQLKDIEAFALSCAPLQDVENRETIEDEIPFKHDRTIRRYSTRIRGKNDEYFGRFYIFEDITARKNAELSLRMQNAAFESFSLAVAITDADAVLEWANPAFSELTGYPLEEVIGQNVKILNSGKMPNEYYKEMWEALLSLKVWTGELINKRKDGTNYWEEETITPILDEKGELIRFIAIKIDITHRKEMENALRISEARWQAALDGSGDGIWDWNTETNEVFFSQQWKTMLGYDTKDVGNTLKEWSDRVFQEDLQSCYNDLNLHFMSESEFYVNEHRMLCKDKTYKWVLDRGKVVHWIEPGKPGRVIVTQTDINESKKFEASLKESIEREKELNEIKSRFVSTASHEFRTPLASILITSDSLKAYWGKLEESQIRDKLTKINNQVFHLTKIVNDVLNISRIEEGKLEINPTETDIVELCSKVVETFNSDPLLKTKIIFESQYSRINLNIDTRLIIQVINNLISNGLKYSPENPEVKVEVILNKEELSISISDNGIGIPEKDKAHLFTPFFRGSNTGSIQGTGLGLNIVKGYVLLHGGSITYKSKPGKGTTFVIHFPAGLITTFK
jgi:PAS domain S-box-containing protein